MRWVVGGSLLEVQGCIERARDIIEGAGYVCQSIETSASREYQFTHNEVGDSGKIKLTVLPHGRTELYGYDPDPPDNRWLVEYLLQYFPSESLSKPLQSLLLTYSWQLENNVFNLSGKELLKRAHSQEQGSDGWDIYGLSNLEIRKKAIAEFKNWRKKFHERRLSEFTMVLGVIESQIRDDGLSITKPTRAEGRKTHTRPERPKEISLQSKPAGRNVDPWNPPAFDILNEGTVTSSNRAFEYWCKQQGIEHPTKWERNAFKKAMKRERARRETN
jgi:hypothetical protein